MRIERLSVLEPLKRAFHMRIARPAAVAQPDAWTVYSVGYRSPVIVTL